MIPLLVDYATPSVFSSSRRGDLLGLAANARRPVRFHGRVDQHLLTLRFALRALGEAIWSDDTWAGELALDPVITVHPDRLLFEAFSSDESVGIQLAVDPKVFTTDGEVVTGTTNVDFSAWLWAALSEMRTSRETWLRIGPEGFEVTTTGGGGRFEQKVELPDSWVRGFLQLQAGMALPGTRLELRPVDLLAAIRFLRYTKAKVSPRALRYELQPGEPARIVLEPWEHVVPLKGCEHSADEPRVIRTWGRRRLRLIEPLLPFAHSVEVLLKGRALPSFYAVHLPGMTFLLALSGWSRQRWTGTASHDLGTLLGGEDQDQLTAVATLLAQRLTLSERELAEELGGDRVLATRMLARLCRQGRALYDVLSRRYRHRELFAEPIDEERLYPPDVRREAADAMVASGQVHLASCAPRETRKVRRLKTPNGPVEREVVYRDWEVTGSAGEYNPVEIVVSETGRIIFGRCPCPFFQENLLNQGPCAHQRALLVVSEAQRTELPSSYAVSAARRAAQAADRRAKYGGMFGGDDDELEEEP